MSSNKAVFLDLQGTLAIIITNQSHISKGYFTYQDYEEKVEELKKILYSNDVYIDGIYCCPHMPEDQCTCIKPLPGMIDQAIKDFDIVKEKSSLTQYRQTWPDYEPNYVADNILDAVKFIVKECTKN